MRFIYEKPATVHDCLERRAYYGPKSRFLAGGSDLLPKLRAGTLAVNALIDIAGLPELQQIRVESKGVFIGAAVRLSAIQNEPRLKHTSYDILPICAGHVSSIAIRNIGTIGGNVCNASPCADMAPALFMLDAQMQIVGPGGRRRVPAEAFFLAPGKQMLKEKELLEGFWIPTPPEGARSWYHKYTLRGDSDVTIVGTGASLDIGADGHIRQARLAVTSAAPTPLRIHAAEALLIGEYPAPELLSEAASICAKACKPITDARASASYRTKMVRYWMEETLKKLMGFA